MNHLRREMSQGYSSKQDAKWMVLGFRDLCRDHAAVRSSYLNSFFALAARMITNFRSSSSVRLPCFKASCSSSLLLCLSSTYRCSPFVMKRLCPSRPASHHALRCLFQSCLSPKAAASSRRLHDFVSCLGGASKVTPTALPSPPQPGHRGLLKTCHQTSAHHGFIASRSSSVRLLFPATS